MCEIPMGIWRTSWRYDAARLTSHWNPARQKSSELVLGDLRWSSISAECLRITDNNHAGRQTVETKYCIYTIMNSTTLNMQSQQPANGTFKCSLFALLSPMVQ